MRDKEETKRKLLVAATQEFAEHGIAGARVDRIAKNAGCNKAMIYAYFCSKENLFNEVLKIQIEDAIKNVPITPDDLPGYAGRLFDRYREQPEILRLAAYHRLESGTMPEAEQEAHKEKTKAIEKANLDTRWSAEELLNLVIHMSTIGLTTPNADRQLVENAVAQLLRSK
ncbi:putative TetR family regulatory protein [Lentzea sp. NBRC 105346]|uniref:TetR family transcriptional regulator n=1 Tax=Lentzea sp. NBRC 105346 TaxID=3032205 RepID=UPI0024A562E1|nr:TetR family transcriptional regulator [Lentzea sp. NBRC 105346]GLZ30009.1 putative TetR family regulatory protein [Lentzea sp. NBRC 105346]